MIMCVFFELFSCLWPAAQDSQDRNGCFPLTRWCVVELMYGVLCRTLFWKNPGLRAGRGEEGVWLEGLVSRGGGGHSPQRRCRNGNGSQMQVGHQSLAA